MEGSGTARPRRDVECPVCGAEAERGQLVCLECGSRLALDYRRPSGWKPAAAVVTAIALAAGVAFAVALAAVDNGSKEEIAKQPPARTAAPVAKRKATAAPAKSRAKRGKRRARPAKKPARAAGVLSWPRKDGFTVVVLSSEDAGSARAFAADAAKQGVKDIGVLNASRYSSLQPGFYLVFVGVYKSRPRAEKAAARLGRRFAGAYPQFVNGTGRS